MADATLTYFPVGNGDTGFIKLSDEATFVIDLNLTDAASDEDDPTRYDVHGHLLKEARKDESDYPHIDGFLLSHPDQDHVRGFRKAFYTGDPAKYSDKDRKAGRIITDELWFAPRIFSPFEEKELSDDATEFKREVDRRISVYRKGGDARNLAGNRIRIIGYTDNPDLKGLEDIMTIPGNTIRLINGSVKKDFEFFVHAPVKKDTDDKWADRNDTSIVLQARFMVDGQENAALAFFGGDAGCAIWETIIEKSPGHSLEWDLFLSTHHCSWTFFSELPSEDNKPSETILNFLDKRKRPGAIVVVSSKEIKDDDDNPPHYMAAELYSKKVGKDHFFCMGEQPTEPLHFRMTKNGPQKDEYSKRDEVMSSAAVGATVSKPQTYGRS